MSFFEPHGYVCYRINDSNPFSKRRHKDEQRKQPHAAIDANLRQIFKTMDAHQAQEIRDAYYKVMEGLYTLTEALEIADAQQKPTAGPLLDEHFNAVNAWTR